MHQSSVMIMMEYLFLFFLKSEKTIMRGWAGAEVQTLKDWLWELESVETEYYKVISVDRTERTKLKQIYWKHIKDFRIGNKTQWNPRVKKLTGVTKIRFFIITWTHPYSPTTALLSPFAWKKWTYINCSGEGIHGKCRWHNTISRMRISNLFVIFGVNVGCSRS